MLGKQQRGEQAGSKRREVDEDMRLTCSGKEGKGQDGRTAPCTLERVSVVYKLAHCPGAAQPWAGTRLCLGEAIWKGCCQGHRDDTRVPARLGWLPCRQGAGTSARLRLGIVPEQVLTDAGPSERVMLDIMLCPMQGWALMGGRLAVPCHAMLCQRHT